MPTKLVSYSGFTLENHLFLIVYNTTFTVYEKVIQGTTWKVVKSSKPCPLFPQDQKNLDALWVNTSWRGCVKEYPHPTSGVCVLTTSKSENPPKLLVITTERATYLAYALPVTSRTTKAVSYPAWSFMFVAGESSQVEMCQVTHIDCDQIWDLLTQKAP